MSGRPVSEFPDNAFWDFSLALYRGPGVEAACIGLQDRLAIDVNLLLYACWIAATGRARMAREDWARLIGDMAAWRGQVVEPLREIRRRLKAGGWSGVPAPLAESLRDRVKALELDAERAEQLAIAAHAPPDAGESPAAGAREADATANLQDYIQAAGAHPTDTDLADLGILARAASGMCKM